MPEQWTLDIFSVISIVAIVDFLSAKETVGFQRVSPRRSFFHSILPRVNHSGRHALNFFHVSIWIESFVYRMSREHTHICVVVCTHRRPETQATHTHTHSFVNYKLIIIVISFVCMRTYCYLCSAVRLYSRTKSTKTWWKGKSVCVSASAISSHCRAHFG